MKLTSMTEFALQRFEILHNAYKEWKSEDHYSAEQAYIRRVDSYARFLKLPLTLGMFVPVDEAGNVLKVPVSIDEWEDTDVDYYEVEILEYNKACEKVLFEGFYYKSNIDRDGKKWEYVRNDFPHVFSFDQLKNNTVETLLTRFKEEYLIELTPSALKQIGLNPVNKIQ